MFLYFLRHASAGQLQQAAQHGVVVAIGVGDDFLGKRRVFEKLGYVGAVHLCHCLCSGGQVGDLLHLVESY